MSVLLGQSYYLRFDAKLCEAMQPYPPLGTLYAASALRGRGHSVAVFDAMLAGSEDEWRAVVRRVRPRYAVLFEDHFNYLSKMCLLRMRQAALAMIDMARAARSTVIVSGSDASDQAELYLNRGADFVLIGEGDATLCELVDHLENGDCGPGISDRGSGVAGGAGAVSAIAGLAFVRDGRVERTPPRPVLTDLDRLPFPAWDLIDVERYRMLWRSRHSYYSMNMVTTRGCPYHCNWCAKPVWGQRYSSRSPENVVAELQWLKNRYRPDHIWFADDIIGLQPGWLPRFAELVERAGVRLPFKCLSRADLLTRKGEVEALKHAGCQIVWLGAESGSQRVLDAMEKGIRVHQIVEAARRLHAAGIQVGFFLQFGYPGETFDDIDATFRLVRECQPDDIGVSVSYPLPGTVFYARVKATLGTRQNWVDSSDLAMLYRGPFTTAFYRQLHHVMHTEFRARRAWRQLRATVRRPSTVKTGDFGRTAAALGHAVTLPYARYRLGRLSRVPHEGIGALPYELTRDEAGQPTQAGD